MRRHQHGAGGLFIALVLIAVIAGALATLAYFQYRDRAGRASKSEQHFATIKNSLQQFVSLNKRLPCPTDADADTGMETGNVLTGSCTFSTGTLPWFTLGLRREDAIDNWGTKISYRVYTGTSGSLTQTDGINMHNCDTSEAVGWNAGRTAVNGSAGGLCRGTKNTLDTEYLAGKGLTITNFGTTYTDAAYVLISHGPTGRGGFTAVSPFRQKALPTNVNELANLSAAGPFVATNHSAALVAPDDAAHFDDLLSYDRISNLARLAGLAARNWDDTVGADVTITAAALESATGTTPGSDLGTTAINFDAARVTGLATSGSTTQNLTFDSSGSADGLGTASGAIGISSTDGEGVRIELKVNAKKFAVTLNNFGTVFFFWRERATVNFYNGTTLVSTATKESCNADGGLASFNFDLGATEFNKVEIFPLTTTTAFSSNFPTSFFLSAFKACASGTCETSLQNAGNYCP